MSVKRYSLKTDGDVKLSPNFSVREFRSKCGSDLVMLDDRLITMLQAIRNHYGRAVRITSGYRTPLHNSRVGGATRSYHTQGMAADINVDGLLPRAIYIDIDRGRVRGIDPARIGLGLYRGFLHIDSRGFRSRFLGKGVTLP